MKKLFLIPLVIFLMTITLTAQSDDVTKEPGYVDFGDFSSLQNSSKVTEVLLDEDLLSALATISNEDDPNIMAILNGLKLVKANVYEITDENTANLKNMISKIDAKLVKENWKRIVKTRSDDEIANIYIKQNSDKKIVGLVVTSFKKGDEAAFVNIVGTIDLATIGKLGKKFNIPTLENVKHKKDK
ncbi:hypothetical protein BMS3Abin03_01285 [bacterium BMS3Abin03]|nr:hypothetical protein BMS3Abin03_01285 [bacterium BMS3Abin03]